MSVKKEPSGRRSISVEVEVPGTPEQVWQAIGTGPGVTSWFVPTEIDGRVGGSIAVHFGPGMDSVAKITEWNPPFQCAAQSEWPAGAPIATEWIVEARTGSTCIVRVVHSLFASTDDWDNQLEGTESGWPAWFQVLRLYLTLFPGQTSSTFLGMATTSGDVAEAWSAMARPLGLAGAKVGQRFAAPAGAPPLSGVVEVVFEGKHHGAIVRVDEPSPGLVFLQAQAMGPQVMLATIFYLYGERGAAAAATAEPAWKAWLADRFAPAGA
jgi:uncharacterized protein YndB with AHSA1/START domain